MSRKIANDTTLQSTKQMLDELDALMEQMLSLPVHDTDDAPAFPKDVVKAPSLTATLTLLEAPAPLHEAKSQPQAPPAVAHPTLNAPHITLPAVAEPAPLTHEVVPISLLPRIEPLLAEVPTAEAARATVWCYLPLVWLNQWFDGLTMPFGALGGLLRTPGSRMFLGLAGLVLVVISACWFVKDWLGWNW